MSEFRELVPAGRRRRLQRKYRPWALLAVPLAAILFQVYVPRFVLVLANLDLPLLATVYFAVMRRNPVGGLLTGASIGLVQDSLSNLPLGVFGMVKTLVGFLAASISIRFDMDRAPVRVALGTVFFYFHHVAYWAVGRALLGQAGELTLVRPAIVGLLNGLVAAPLFGLFDRLRRSDE